jgi:twitching motility protein PilT
MSDAFAEVRLRDIVHVALSRGASDVHLTSGRLPAIRVDGELVTLPGTPLSPATLDALVHILLGEERRALVARGEEVTGTRREDEGRTYRVHGFHTLEGPALSLRLLESAIPELERLQLPPGVGSTAMLRHGLVIFAGPTGSGKTTSLAALIDRINTSHARRIVTIEDPVEYVHRDKCSTIVQREIGRDARTYESAIRGALRADPDVIVVGEMREREAIRAVLGAAETGHLVLTTLHTSDAASSVDRIVDAFAGEERTFVRSQLALVLHAVFAQRLVQRTGKKGRRAIVEVLVANDAVRATIRDGRTHQLRNCMLMGRAFGMQTLESHLQDLVVRGEIEAGTAACIA